MININCNGCSNHCCGMNKGLTPVLLPSEEHRFEGKTTTVKTPYREMKLLRKKESGMCYFLDEETNRCTAYNDRPLECQLFPFLLSFGKRETRVRLDEENCPNLSTLVANEEQINSLIAKYQIPENWIKGYSALTGV